MSTNSTIQNVSKDTQVNSQQQQQQQQQSHQQQNQQLIQQKLDVMIENKNGNINSKSKTHSKTTYNHVFSPKSFKWMNSTRFCTEIHFIIDIHLDSITNEQIYVLIDIAKDRIYPMITKNNALIWNDKTRTTLDQLQNIDMNNNQFTKNKFINVDSFMKNWYKINHIQKIFSFTVLETLDMKQAKNLDYKLIRRWFIDYNNDPTWVIESNINHVKLAGNFFNTAYNDYELTYNCNSTPNSNTINKNVNANVKLKHNSIPNEKINNLSKYNLSGITPTIKIVKKRSKFLGRNENIINNSEIDNTSSNENKNDEKNSGNEDRDINLPNIDNSSDSSSVKDNNNMINYLSKYNTSVVSESNFEAFTHTQTDNVNNNIKIYNSDKYSWRIYRFYNPIIKEFSIDIFDIDTIFYHRNGYNTKRELVPTLKMAIERSKNNTLNVYLDGNQFIPFKKILNQGNGIYVKFNVGEDIDLCKIGENLMNVCATMEEQGIDEEAWIFDLVAYKKFKVKTNKRKFCKLNTNEMNEVNIDFIFHYDCIINIATWTNDKIFDFLAWRNLDVYFLLSTSNYENSGIPVKFEKVVNGDNIDYNVLLDNIHGKMKIGTLQKHFKNNSNVIRRISCVMELDWNCISNLLLFDRLKNEWELNLEHYYNLKIIKNEVFKKGDCYINPIHTGGYFVIKYNTTYFPIYILNQNFVRFQSHIVAVSDIDDFIVNGSSKDRNNIVLNRLPARGKYCDVTCDLNLNDFIKKNVNIENKSESIKVGDNSNINKSKINKKVVAIPQNLQRVVDIAMGNSNNNNNNNNSNNSIQNKNIDDSNNRERSKSTDSTISEIRTDINNEKRELSTGNSIPNDEYQSQSHMQENQQQQQAQQQPQNEKSCEKSQAQIQNNINPIPNGSLQQQPQKQNNINPIQIGPSQQQPREKVDGLRNNNDNYNRKKKHSHRIFNPDSIPKLPKKAVENSLCDEKFSIFSIEDEYREFSNRKYQFDNATGKQFNNEDKNFEVIDMVSNIAQKARTKTDNYYKFKFTSKVFRYNNTQAEFASRLHAMCHQIGFPWIQLYDDYLFHIYRMSDIDYANRKLDDQHRRKQWQQQQQQGNQNTNRNQPVWNGVNNSITKKVDNASYADKINDKSGANFYISDPIDDQKNNGNKKEYIITNGIIDFKNSKMTSENCVIVYIDPSKSKSIMEERDAIFRLKNSFFRWKHQRQNMEINLDTEFNHDIDLIIEPPKAGVTYKITVPQSHMGDIGGNQFTLKRKIIDVMTHHNFMLKLKGESNQIPIDISQLRSVHRGNKNSPNAMAMAKMNWERWLTTPTGKSFNNMSDIEQQKYYNQNYLKYLYTNTIYIKFDQPQPHFPSFFDFGFYKWNVVMIDKLINEFTGRMDDMQTCYTCGSAECSQGRCPDYKLLIESIIDTYKLREKFNTYTLAMREAKRRIGKCCGNCGQSGGHWGQKRCPNPMGCKFCGSKNHNSTKSMDCPYWCRYVIITLLFDDFYKKNLKNNGEFMQLPGSINGDWKMNEDWVYVASTEELTDPVKLERVKRIWRMTDIIKYNIKNGDVFGRDLNIDELTNILCNENEDEEKQNLLNNNTVYYNFCQRNIQADKLKQVLNDMVESNKEMKGSNDEDENDEDEDVDNRVWNKPKRKGKITPQQQREILRRYNKYTVSDNTKDTTVITNSNGNRKNRNSNGNRKNRNRNSNKSSRSVEIIKMKQRLNNINDRNRRAKNRRNNRRRKRDMEREKKQKEMDEQLTETRKHFEKNKEKYKNGNFVSKHRSNKNGINKSRQQQQQQNQGHTPNQQSRQQVHQQQQQQQQSRKQAQQQNGFIPHSNIESPRPITPQLQSMNTDRRNTLPALPLVENMNEINGMVRNLQSNQYQHIDNVNGNQGINSMYLNNNPSMGSARNVNNNYRPKNNHNQRTLNLGHPNSFISANFANEITAAGDVVGGGYGPTRNYSHNKDDHRYTNHEYQNHNGNFYKAKDTRFDPMGHKINHVMSEYDGVIYGNDINTKNEIHGYGHLGGIGRF